jgi:hypothetical protein
MKTFSRSLVLAGLLVSVGAHAQPAVATHGAPHAAAYHAKRGVLASQASVHKAKVSGVVRSVPNIPSGCASCPLAATCYPS